MILHCSGIACAGIWNRLRLCVKVYTNGIRELGLRTRSLASSEPEEECFNVYGQRNRAGAKKNLGQKCCVWRGAIDASMKEVATEWIQQSDVLVNRGALSSENRLKQTHFVVGDGLKGTDLLHWVTPRHTPLASHGRTALRWLQTRVLQTTLTSQLDQRSEGSKGAGLWSSRICNYR